MSPVKPLFALLALLSLAVPARAAGDVAEGRKLVEENRCESCHAEKTLGDAKAVYLRKDHKVTSMEKLKAQVALCNSTLGLKLFPEDEEHIAAYLNATYYKFGSK
jgi:cytochrome c2